MRCERIISFSRKAQVGIEYLMIVGFVTFAIISILTISLFYSSQIKDKIRLNQVENFVVQLTNSAESVFFAGEPSKTTVRLYLPDGVNSIVFICSGGGDPICPEGETYYVVANVDVSSGENRRVYESRVPINGSIPITEGIKKLTLEASEDYVLVS